MTVTRPFLPYFNPSRPVFVKQNGLQAAGTIWKQGDRFKWENFGTPFDTIQQMFFNDQLYHNEEFEDKEAVKVSVGDGLDDLTLEQLHIVVEKINEKVKAKVKTNKDYNEKKCAFIPKDRNAQIRRIRNWRLTYGELE